MEPLPNRATVAQASAGHPNEGGQARNRLCAQGGPVDPVTQFAKATPEPSLPLPTTVPKVTAVIGMTRIR